MTTEENSVDGSGFGLTIGLALLSSSATSDRKGPQTGAWNRIGFAARIPIPTVRRVGRTSFFQIDLVELELGWQLLVVGASICCLCLYWKVRRTVADGVS